MWPSLPILRNRRERPSLTIATRIDAQHKESSRCSSCAANPRGTVTPQSYVHKGESATVKPGRHTLLRSPFYSHAVIFDQKVTFNPS